MTFPGFGNYHFVLVPEKESKKIREVFGVLRQGFGSLKVIVRVGTTKWKTSIFPESKSGNYFLLLKSQLRKKENIKIGDEIPFTIEILV